MNRRRCRLELLLTRIDPRSRSGVVINAPSKLSNGSLRISTISSALRDLEDRDRAGAFPELVVDGRGEPDWVRADIVQGHAIEPESHRS